MKTSSRESFTTHLDAFESSTGLGSSNSMSIVTTEGNMKRAHTQTRDFEINIFMAKQNS